MRLQRLSGLLLATLVVCLGCSAPASASTPAAAVREALRLVDAGDLEALVALTCDAQKDAIRRQFSFSDIARLAPGTDLTPLFSSLELDVTGVTIAETNRSEDSALVQVAGTLIISLDAEQLRDIFRSLAEAQGVEPDPAQLDALIAGLAVRQQPVPVNVSIPTVQENGSWKVCDRLTLIPTRFGQG